MNDYSYEVYAGLSAGQQAVFTACLRRMLDSTWRRITRGLLDKVNQSLIKPPQIAFTESTAFLGRWSRDSNTIEINFRLVLDHPWYAVEHVFYHEAAHKLHDFLFPGSLETAHGQEFRNICRSIGADPSATADVTELDKRLFSGEKKGADDIVSKVKKLLVLADEGEEHEAEVALAKALQIMARCGISRDDLGEEDFCTITLGKPARFKRVEDIMLMNLLEDFWNVEAVWVCCPNLEMLSASKSSRFLPSISGSSANVKIASYVYDFIRQAADAEWNRYRILNELPDTKRLKRDFTMGMLNGIRTRLRKDAGQEQVMAMIHLEKAKVQNYVNARYPELSKVRSKQVSCNRVVTESGEKAGKTLEIHPGVASNTPKLLK